MSVIRERGASAPLNPDDDEGTRLVELHELGCPRRTALEQIDDETAPYFTDDPATTAFPDDGRLEVEH